MKKLRKYLIYTFGITWTLWWSDAILVKYTFMREADLLPMILFTLGGFGPTIAALICFEEKISRQNIMSFLFACRKKSILYVLLFALTEFLVFGLSSMELNSAIEPSLIPIIVLQAIFLYGGNEELGWRGIMQPLLQKTISYPIATLIVSIVWSLWHIPLWFIEGNSHQGSSFIVFAVLACLLCFWLAAIINCGGSVFLCMVLHGITNTLLSVFVIRFNIILIIGLVTLTAVSVLVSMLKTKGQAQCN